MRLRPRFVSFLLWFNGIGAVFGSWYLLDGAPGMDIAWLEGSSFDSYTIPGIVLLVVVGNSSLLAAGARFKNHALASYLTLLAGTILLIWLAVEFVIVPEGWPLQLLFGVIGALMVAGATDEIRRSRA